MYEDTLVTHKHGLKNIYWIVPLVIFLMVSVLPVNALIFENDLFGRNERLVADVKLVSRDPYLAQAINGLPNYRYTTAGSIEAGSNHVPVTIAGNWPAPVRIIHTIAEVTDIRPKVAQAAQIDPTQGSKLVLEGEASFYSRAGCLGCNPLRIMANGQPLNDNALTMAIGANRKHLVGHTARVTNLRTGKSVMVRITDTGGFYAAKYGNRVADLTIASKQAIGMNGGVGQVRVEVF